MIIIADSGSTKTEWITQDHRCLVTKGINPVRDTEEEILNVLATELMPWLYLADGNASLTDREQVEAIYFHGAGCIPPFAQHVYSALHHFFPNASIRVHSDLLGAARALCGNEEGIACILGTGSNSCLCRGGEIVRNIPPLGYILGDEGSGAVLGRTLLAEMLKGDLQDLWSDFSDEWKMKVEDIIERVYRQPAANRFLASLMPFVHKHRTNPAVREMLVGEFSRFLRRCVLPYGRRELPVNFVGGVACHFQEEVREALALEGLKEGTFMPLPAKSLLKYYKYVI